MNHSATKTNQKLAFPEIGNFSQRDTEKNRNAINQNCGLTFVKSEELTELEGEKNAWFLNCSHSSPKGSGFCTVASATSAMKKIPSINPCWCTNWCTLQRDPELPNLLRDSKRKFKKSVKLKGYLNCSGFCCRFLWENSTLLRGRQNASWLRGI